jgi:rod shape determining protein RodA
MIKLDAIRSRSGYTESSRGFFQNFHLDGALLLGIFILSLIGLAVLYSANDQQTGLIIKQSVRLAVAFLVMIVAAQITPQSYEFWTPWIYSTVMLLLLIVLIIGVTGKGAQRWLNLGIINFQPSELMKLAVPMMIAWFLSETPLPPRWPRVLVCFLILLAPAILVAKQPDLGTALLIAMAGVFVLLLAGLRWRFVVIAFAGTACLTPLLWYLMHDYQRRRVLTLFNPENDPLGAGYHIIQSKIAIGSGGMYGKGWLNGTQSHLEFLPERTTDFIFAVYGEEFGFVGVLFLIAIYLAIIFRGLYIATQAQTTYARLLAGGLVMMFLVHVFVNIAMVIGLLPVVGIPLPLISYGGTSIVTIMATFGILMSLHTHKKLLAQ